MAEVVLKSSTSCFSAASSFSLAVLPRTFGVGLPADGFPNTTRHARETAAAARVPQHGQGAPTQPGCPNTARVPQHARRPTRETAAALTPSPRAIAPHARYIPRLLIRGVERILAVSGAGGPVKRSNSIPLLRMGLAPGYRSASPPPSRP
eukprot:1190837-Prorocentrum_minimum.AAC.2